MPHVFELQVACWKGPVHLGQSEGALPDKRDPNSNVSLPEANQRAPSEKDVHWTHWDPDDDLTQPDLHFQTHLKFSQYEAAFWGHWNHETRLHCSERMPARPEIQRKQVSCYGSIHGRTQDVHSLPRTGQKVGVAVTRPARKTAPSGTIDVSFMKS